MISIVICSRQRPASLRRTLHSLSKMVVPGGFDWEVVVVDNNTDDVDSRRVTQHFQDRLPIRLLHEPISGLSRARNHAMGSLPASHHSVWTDDDVIVSADWLSVYERAFRFWPAFDFFGGPVRAEFSSTPPWAQLALEVAPEAFAHIDPTPEFVELNGDTDFLPFGANMAFRAGVLEGLRFDERLGRQPGAVLRGGEELELFRNLLSRGSHGLWLPLAAVRHCITPERETPRHVYDHALGDGFVEEVCDAGADLDSIANLLCQEKVDARYRRRAALADLSADRPGDQLRALKQAGRQDGRRLAWSCISGHFRQRSRRRRPLLVIGLDGFVNSIADEMMLAGELPQLRQLRASSARFELDHGDAYLSGLAWEHFSTGRAPHDYQRFSAVDFDARTYGARQRGTREPTFVAHIDSHTVVFDVPYFDLDATPRTSGLVAWGAHDAGTTRTAKPATLAAEIGSRFGSYPAARWIYGFAWPCVDGAARMAGALEKAVERRADIAKWLFSERFDNWELALMTVSEFHSAIEGLWHGVDAEHPLHRAGSARAAAQGIHGVYRATDRLLGSLRAALPQVDIMLCSMHGMGRNRSDVGTMLLLPELLFRSAFATTAFAPRPDWLTATAAHTMLDPHEDWSAAVLAQLSLPGAFRPETDSSDYLTNLGFMPAMHYQPAWHAMDAFALPSFYDGRIRINLMGRERHGRVKPEDYSACCERLIELLAACRDWQTGEAIVDRIVRNAADDPLQINATDCDLSIRWKSASLGWIHPTLGTIGPAPMRRPGGHGGPGLAWLSSPGVAPGDYGRQSSFDIVPTIFALRQQDRPKQLSGNPLAFSMKRAE